MNGYYINLDYRTDRKIHFDKNVKSNSFFKNINRFSAIKESNGYIGCSKSHIEVLEKCLDKDGEYFMICEDDLQINNNESLENFITNFNKIKNVDKWDLITLTPYYCQPHHEQDNTMLQCNFIRLITSQTTTAYIIKKTFIKILLDNIKYSMNKLSNGEDNKFVIDQYWKNLFPSHNIYVFKNIFASQLSGYSDNLKEYANYKY
jgi:glycosyl transferase, family 25